MVVVGRRIPNLISSRGASGMIVTGEGGPNLKEQGSLSPYELEVTETPRKASAQGRAKRARGGRMKNTECKGEMG